MIQWEWLIVAALLSLFMFAWGHHKSKLFSCWIITKHCNEEQSKILIGDILGYPSHRIEVEKYK